MPDTRYLCIDDQQDDSVDHLLAAISRAGGLQFERRTPVEVGDQISAIVAFASECRNGFGLLLDLRLDTETNKEGTRVPYRGPTLAQELRTRMAEGAVSPSFPIVLWSIANKLAVSYREEDAAHDLFDAVYGKDDRIQNEPSAVASELRSLVSGYRAIQAGYEGVPVTRAMRLLGLEDGDEGGVYSAFVDELCFAMESGAPHKVARLIMTQLVATPGLLAGERLVALRLGVDAEASGSNWTELKGMLSHARYSGPFNEGWARWWWFKVEDWWATLAERQPNLRRITAGERTAILNARFGLSLIDAKPAFAGEGTKFFTQCVATGHPLDPSNGLRVTQVNRKPWHDTRYVSLESALARTNKEKWRIDPIDRGVFEAAKVSRSS